MTPTLCLALLLAQPAPPTWPGYGGPTRDFLAAGKLADGALAGDPVVWRRALGPGESQIVTDGKALYTAYSVPDAADKKKGTEVVVALNPATGKTLWEHPYPVAMLPKQETFRGAPVGPQATPLVVGGRVVALGFAGVLHGLDAATGKVAWKHDLVKEYEATPVQFGFAGSPVAYKDTVLVHAGGRQATVIAFDAKDGSVRWKSKPAEPGYATPVVATVNGEDQVIQLTRDEVVAVAAADGTPRWAYPLPTKGLTNVPTPIVVGDDRVLVSGQGVVGTRLLAVSKDNKVTEVWKAAPKFFYANWAVRGGVAYGFAGDRFVAVRLSDGEVLWQESSQKDANWVGVGDAALVLRGDGRLAWCKLSADGLDEKAAAQVLTGRTWTAPTVVGDRLFARSAAEVVCVRLGGR